MSKKKMMQVLQMTTRPGDRFWVRLVSPGVGIGCLGLELLLQKF
jgi:hypothetical protein